MADVSLIVPYRADIRAERRKPRLIEGAHRSEIWTWARSRWEALFPHFEIVTGEGSTVAEMNRSEARNNAVTLSNGEILVIADADTVCPSVQVNDALRRVEAGLAEWVIAYNDYYQLSGKDTREVLAQEPGVSLWRPVKPRWSTDQGNAGMLVVTREAFERVEGYDERFHKWGWEDWAFSDALGTLVHGAVRVPGYVLHLCHPRPVDKSKKQGKALSERYAAAHGHPEAMEALIHEEDRRG
jgi:hypothetical protein